MDGGSLQFLRLSMMYDLMPYRDDIRGQRVVGKKNKKPGAKSFFPYLVVNPGKTGPYMV